MLFALAVNCHDPDLQSCGALGSTSFDQLSKLLVNKSKLYWLLIPKRKKKFFYKQTIETNG